MYCSRLRNGRFPFITSLLLIIGGGFLVKGFLLILEAPDRVTNENREAEHERKQQEVLMMGVGIVSISCGILAKCCESDARNWLPCWYGARQQDAAEMKEIEVLSNAGPVGH